MSLGQSSFLSAGGFELDPPQIEITLDDIFTSGSGWDGGLGFPMQMGHGTPSGMGLVSPFSPSGASSIWSPGALNGIGSHGSLANLFGGAHHYPIPQQGNPMTNSSDPSSSVGQKPEGPICANCGVTSTPLWRRSVNDKTLCNACGLYYKLHNTDRPRTLRPHITRKDSRQEDINNQLDCSNCQTTQTPLWRRDEEGNVLCNACGLYYKLHKSKRPLSLKTGIIRKRQRYDNKSGSNGRKRKDDSSDGPNEGDSKGGVGVSGISGGSNLNGFSGGNMDYSSSSSDTGNGGGNDNTDATNDPADAHSRHREPNTSNTNGFGMSSHSLNTFSNLHILVPNSTQESNSNISPQTRPGSALSPGINTPRMILPSLRPATDYPSPINGNHSHNSSSTLGGLPFSTTTTNTPKNVPIASAINIPISPLSTPKTDSTHFSRSPTIDSVSTGIANPTSSTPYSLQ